LRAAGFSSEDISALFPDNLGTKEFAHEKIQKRRKVRRLELLLAQ